MEKRGNSSIGWKGEGRVVQDGGKRAKSARRASERRWLVGRSEFG